MVIECCAQERTYLRFYGSLGERFCMIKNEYQVCSLPLPLPTPTPTPTPTPNPNPTPNQVCFDECFAKQYTMIHRLETNKLRNIAKFFAHLLHSNGNP